MADKQRAIVREESLNELTLSLPCIPFSRFKVLNLLGKGGYGNVYKGEWDGLEVAIKQLHIASLPFDLLQEFRNEAKIMHKCQHPNIVRFFAISVEEGKDSIIMEYLPKGSLFQNLCDSRIELDWNLRWNISFDIAKGLSYLHLQNIIHRDLKSMNVLLESNWKAKITDFGMAKIKVATETITKEGTKVGSIRWRAPEMFRRGAKYTTSSDIYSFGVLLWEIAARKIPYAEEASDTVVMAFIKDNEKEEIPVDCPYSFAEIIKECWRNSPNERPDATSVVAKIQKEIPSKDPRQEEYEQGLALFESNGYLKCVPFFQKAADLGYPPAFLRLLNDREAAKHFSWFENAAKSGHPRDLFNLAFCYKEGLGTPQDFKRAIDLFTKAADCGYAPAQCTLGFCYDSGNGVAKDAKKARELFQESSDQGFAAGSYNLGHCYYFGKGDIGKDVKKAIECYEKAAAQGHVFSMEQLGDIYLETKDYTKALSYYEKAAEVGPSLGTYSGQYKLSLCYLNGWGVPKDKDIALSWCTKAANHGNEKAKKLLQTLQ